MAHARMKRLKVEYERWGDGWWIARIPAVKGVHSNGRTVEEARRRVREALAVATDEGWDEQKAEAAVLVDEIRLTQAARRAIAQRKAALGELQAAARSVEEATESSIRALVSGMGLSVRDVAALLGLSHQRVHQLASAGGYDSERHTRGSIAREPAARYRVDRRAAAKRKR